MEILSRRLADEAETRQLGADLAPALRRGDVVALRGDLGAGKTTLARGLLKALGIEGEIQSPTFPLVLTYETAMLTVAHFDLYRLERAEDVYELGIEDAFRDGVSLVEWPECAEGLLPDTVLDIGLEIAASGRRARLAGAAFWRDRLAAAGIVGES